jgi:hypothetical protein
MLNDIGELVLLMMGRYVSTSWLAVADRFNNLLEAKETGVVFVPQYL